MPNEIKSKKIKKLQAMKQKLDIVEEKLKKIDLIEKIKSNSTKQ